MRLDPKLLSSQVAYALEEDLGSGDLTANLIPPQDTAAARLIGRERAVLAGRPWFQEVFRQLDPAVSIVWSLGEGETMVADQVLCELHGSTRALLTGERTALNYLQTLSGTATLARRYADAVAGTGVRILDTRKTLPGLRVQQKYAVTCGGCHNHRIGLYDAILIKENHIAAAGSLSAAVEAARRLEAGVGIEVEVENLEQLEEALRAGVEHILLDNFPLERLREAVRIAWDRARLEASGGISLDRVRAIAETGVDDISVGALTKDVRAVDLSMRFL